MSKRRWLGVAAAGMGATAAAVTAGFFVERKVVSTRRAGAPGADELGGLRGEPFTLRTDDGVTLHAEVDEVAPYSQEAAKTRSASRAGALRRRVPADPTIVFVHGYALNLDCWHFQRGYFRGKHRMVFYDQRSHGRSGRSDKAHATIDQLGDDLRRVIEELVPEGPVVLVGHSMGGMSIVAFAEQHPELFDDRVVGAAPDLHDRRRPEDPPRRQPADPRRHRRAGRPAGDRRPGPRARAGRLAAPRAARTSASWSPSSSRSARTCPRRTSSSSNKMLAATSFEVLAEFFPNFDTLDKFDVLAAFAQVPTTILSGTKDVLTSVGHSRKMAKRIPGSRLVECAGAGHMVILEQKDQVNTALEELFAAAAAGRTSRVS